MNASTSGPRPARALSWGFAMATIGLQIAYPLVGEEGQRRITIASVTTFVLSSLAHAWSVGGLRAATALALIGAGTGWAAEVVGSRTGFPFGRYEYADTLGWKLAGVPVVVPLAWAMMAWPALLAGRRAGHPVVVGAAILVTWDLFLDPQMVGDGHWRWSPSAWPDLHGIPVSNALGWVLVSTVLLVLLHRAVTVPARLESGPPAVLLAWTWFSETLGHLTFFGRPSVALAGGLSMAAALAPVLRRWRAGSVPGPGPSVPAAATAAGGAPEGSGP